MGKSTAEIVNDGTLSGNENGENVQKKRYRTEDLTSSVDRSIGESYSFDRSMCESYSIDRSMCESYSVDRSV